MDNPIMAFDNRKQYGHQAFETMNGHEAFETMNGHVAFGCLALFFTGRHAPYWCWVSLGGLCLASWVSLLSLERSGAMLKLQTVWPHGLCKTNKVDSK